jgi:hypothetical protein
VSGGKTPEVKLVSVRCFEVFASDGSSLGLFKVDSEWKGLACLKSVNSEQQFIVQSPARDKFGGIFDDIFGEHRMTSPVFLASPDIATKVAPSTNATGSQA